MNRLATEPSPYLRQHRDNPVDWHPWGPEALALARTLDRPILLSVGYSACHWCHVMAHESFEDPATAEVMNRHFVNIKVDREERPDLDQLYQGVVQLMGRGGGWPLTVFLLPDLRPFYGGTYFPPAPRHGLPAFRTLLEAIGRAWLEEREELDRQARTFEEGLTSYTTYGLDTAPSNLARTDVVTAATAMAGRIDPRHGGFGPSGPKFPMPSALAAILRGYRVSGEATLLSGVERTLRAMARGGIHDQLGGGFHRYSVDERWLVPHFEKMLYDNAQLLHLYTELYLIRPDPEWAAVVERLVGWLEREMVHPGGAFLSAQDADSEGEEGKSFVWRPREVEALLSSDDARLLQAHLGLREAGNFEHGATVLAVERTAAELAAEHGGTPEEIAARLARAKDVLLAARQQRVAPGIDDKILAGWNGLTIRGLALAGRVFRRAGWVAMARRAADFVLDRMRAPDGGLFRSFQADAPRHDGVVEDYGDLAAGLTALYQACFEPRYLEAAVELAEQAHRRFWDPSRQAYRSAHTGQADLVVPTYALHDGAVPSGASTLAEAQVAIGALTGDSTALERARTYIERLRGQMLEHPLEFGHLWQVADTLADGAAEVSVIGTAEGMAPLLEVLDRRYLPTVAVHRLERDAPVPAVAREVLSARPSRGAAAAYLCRSFACQAPVTTPAELEALLDRG